MFYSEEACRKLLDKQGHANKQLPKLCGKRLASIHIELSRLVSGKMLNDSRFNNILPVIDSLKNTFGAYSTFLLQKNIANKENHRRTHQLDLNRELETIPGCVHSGKVRTCAYRDLVKKLCDLQDYEPLNLYTVAPIEPMNRYRWILGIGLPFPVQIYKIKSKQVAFVWKIGETDDEKTIQNKNINIIQDIDKKLHIYHTRAMIKRASTHFKGIKTWTKDNYSDLYHMVTNIEMHDEPDVVLIEEIKEKVEMGMCVEEIISEEESAIAQRRDKFSKFWQAAESLIDEYTTPQERRHGIECYISPIAPSIRALWEMSRAKAFSMFPNIPDLPVPGLEWFRRQFSPSNPYAKTASQYTGRFNGKMGLQTRLLRKTHPDHHYGSKLLCYFKEHASR